jgi:hypothetical protein
MAFNQILLSGSGSERLASVLNPLESAVFQPFFPVNGVSVQLEAFQWNGRLTWRRGLANDGADSLTGHDTEYVARPIQVEHVDRQVAFPT